MTLSKCLLNQHTFLQGVIIWFQVRISYNELNLHILRPQLGYDVNIYENRVIFPSTPLLQPDLVTIQDAC